MPYVGRNVQHLVAVDLPLPPSVNRAFLPSKGQFLRKAGTYLFWLDEVKDGFNFGEALPKLPAGRYGLFLELPRLMAGDVDNRFKLVADVMRHASAKEQKSWNAKDYPGLAVTPDDKFMDAYYVQRADHVPEGRCYVTAVTMDRWCDYVCMRLSD